MKLYQYRITGGHITGDVADNVRVPRSTSQVGGEIAFQIDGNALGDITASEVQSISIAGNVLGEITIGELATGGLVSVGIDLLAPLWIGRLHQHAVVNIAGNAGADITLLQMLPQSGALIGGSVPEDVTIIAQLNDECALVVNANVELHGTNDSTEGRIELTAGIPYHAAVTVAGEFSGSSAVLDLHAKDIRGALRIRRGNGTVANGGVVYEQWQSALWGVFLGSGNGVYSGSADFAGVSYDGQIVMYGADLAGSLLIDGDMQGWMDFGMANGFGGNITETGQLSITGLLTGLLYVRGNVDGVINVGDAVEDDMTGEIRLLGDEVSGTVALTGRVLGILTVQELLTGEICALNLSASDVLPPHNVYVGEFGGSAKICGVANTCGSFPVAAGVPIPLQEAVAKNRYLSVVPGNSGTTAGIRVRLTELPSGGTNGNFAAHDREFRWVGPPVSAPEVDYFGGTFTAAPLQCDPYYTDWSSYGTVHIYGAEVVPGATYEVQLVDTACGSLLAFENNYSTALTVTTTKWGDVSGSGGVPDNVVNLADVSYIIASFQNAATSVIKARSQIQGDVPNPMQPPNLNDVNKGVMAFQGFPYPFGGPMTCP